MNKKLKKIIKILAIIIFIIITGVISFKIYIYYFFDIFECQNKIISIVENQKKDKYLIMYERDCGVTNSPSIILTTKDTQDLISEDIVTEGFFISNYPECIKKFGWENDKNIFVEHTCEPEKIFKQEMNFKNIFIKYKKID